MNSNIIRLPDYTQYTCPNCGNQWDTTYTWQNINRCWKCGMEARAEIKQAYNVYD